MSSVIHVQPVSARSTPLLWLLSDSLWFQVTNTDDFILRLVQGCVQLGLVQDINNTVNMVPVDHVALCTSLAAVSPLPDAAMSVLHVTARHIPTFNGILSSLKQYGYPTEPCEYVVAEETGKARHG